MKKFLAIYLGSATAASAEKWEALDEKTRSEKERTGMEAWKNWIMKNKSSLIDMGSPLGSTKRVDGAGTSDTQNHLTGYTVVQAESHEAAAKMFLDHPHFKIFPGDSVEIMECLPIPGM